MPDESTATEERPRRTWTPARREAQARRRAKPAEATDGELIAEDVVGEAVANTITLAGFIMPMAPYTAVTIAGVIHPEDEESENPRWIVRSRAHMAGAVLLEHAKRNRRVLAAIARFNLMFKNVELVEVVGSVVASAAVDAQLVEPDATMKLPGGMEVPILAPAIGDTIAYIADQEEQARAAGIEVPKRRRRTESSEGVTKPEAPWSPEAANGRDPTQRQEGQIIIPGDVTNT